MLKKENIKTFDVPECVLCGNSGDSLYMNLQDVLFGVPGVWSIVKCVKCGHVWLNPAPTRHSLPHVYSNYYTHVGDGSINSKFASLKNSLRATILSDCYGYGEHVDKTSLSFLGKLLSTVPMAKEFIGMSVMGLEASLRGKLLEIGSGSGKFLAEMRNLGWKVVGVEPDSQAACIAREKYGLDIHVGALEEVALPSNSFDVISMNHVLEHIQNPILLFKECNRILKPGGRLVVVTPNISSCGHMWFKRHWRGLEPPRHLNLFSLSSVKTCAEKSGFKVEVLRTSTRSARGMWVASGFIRKGKNCGDSDITWGRWGLGVLFQVFEESIHFLIPTVGEELYFRGVKK